MVNAQPIADSYFRVSSMSSHVILACFLGRFWLLALSGALVLSAHWILWVHIHIFGSVLVINAFLVPFLFASVVACSATEGGLSFETARSMLSLPFVSGFLEDLDV